MEDALFRVEQIAIEGTDSNRGFCRVLQRGMTAVCWGSQRRESREEFVEVTWPGVAEWRWFVESSHCLNRRLEEGLLGLIA